MVLAHSTYTFGKHVRVPSTLDLYESLGPGSGPLPCGFRERLPFPWNA
jgi:hypothetical protein